jgi:hypothetical protein|tara:strand:- start:139 stop:279 length:141 start_codon:yes stop_codon:yes gene_type:complete
MGKFEITYKESFRKNKKEIIFASSFGDAETKFRNEKLKRIEQIKEI